MPKISVVIPTLNRPHLLRRAVESVLAQTLRDIEVIVVVDGPDPVTKNEMDQIDDNRIRVIVHQERRGAAVARDTGAQAANAEWIAFLDDDDEWLKTKLERQFEVALFGPALITTLTSVRTFERITVRPEVPFGGDMLIDEWMFGRRTWLGGGGFIQASSLMVPKINCINVRFAHMEQHDDWEFALRVVKEAGLPLITIREALVLHSFEEGRPTLQSTLEWEGSITWAKRLTTLLTPMSRSGFLLTVVARSAANRGQYRAFFPLLKSAFQIGRPTTKQLFAFAISWMIPRSARRSFQTIRGKKAAYSALA